MSSELVPPRVLTIPTALSNSTTLQLSSPADHVLVVTLNRPKHLNVFNQEMEEEMRQILEWVDDDKSVWAVILTGAGSAFCAGGDLKPAFNAAKNAPDAPIPAAAFYGLTRDGFGHLSRRSRTTKPIIAAVNGIALGGGMEIVLNCDLVVASQNARFGFVEVRNGLVAVQGAIPRLSRISGYQLAAETYLLGRTVSAREGFERLGFVNRVVPPEHVLSTAIEFASRIVALSMSAAEHVVVTNSTPNISRIAHALESLQMTKRRLMESRNQGTFADDCVPRL